MYGSLYSAQYGMAQQPAPRQGVGGGWLDRALNDPNRRMLATMGLGMLAGSGQGLSLAENLGRAGMVGIEARDQVISKQKEEERLTREDARRQAATEAQVKLAQTQLKDVETKMKKEEEKGKFLKSLPERVSAVSQITDPELQQRAAQAYLGLAQAYGAGDEAGQMFGQFTPEGKRAARKDEAQIGAAETQQRAAQTEIDQRRVETQRLQQAPGVGQPYMMNMGEYQVPMVAGPKGDLSPLPADVMTVKPPPAQQAPLSNEKVQEISAQSTAKAYLDKLEKTLRTDPNQLLALPGNREAATKLDAKTEIANLQKIWPNLSPEDQERAKALIPELQRRMRR